MTITKRSLTTGEHKGSGIFDELMRTVKSHVHEELIEGRITEQSYSQVYLGSLQSTLNSALQFTLQYEINNKQIEVMEEQIKQAQKQNELLDLQKEQLRLANLTAQYNLDVVLPKQSATMDAQKAQVEAQTEVTIAQVNKITAEVLLLGKQEDMLDEQILSEKTNTQTPSAGLARAQYDKTQAEIEVLSQKKLTEVAQTSGSVPMDNSGGLVGAEMRLKKQQADSFIRDAEQKAAKLMADTFSVLASIEYTGLEPSEWGFNATNSSDLVNELKSGVITR